MQWNKYESCIGTVLCLRYWMTAQLDLPIMLNQQFPKAPSVWNVFKPDTLHIFYPKSSVWRVQHNILPNRGQSKPTAKLSMSRIYYSQCGDKIFWGNIIWSFRLGLKSINMLLYCGKFVSRENVTKCFSWHRRNICGQRGMLVFNRL